MNTKMFDTAFDFLPQTKAKPRSGAFAWLVAFFHSIEQGRTARHRYEQLTAAGIEPGAAARAVHDEVFKSN